jgi:hypothetical protein
MDGEIKNIKNSPSSPFNVNMANVHALKNFISISIQSVCKKRRESALKHLYIFNQRLHSCQYHYYHDLIEKKVIIHNLSMHTIHLLFLQFIFKLFACAQATNKLLLLSQIAIITCDEIIRLLFFA